MATRRIMMGLALAVAVACPALSWAEFVAKVVAVHEGDRISIFYAGRTERIAIKGIDCPELKQPYGKKARQVTQAYVGTRDVVVRGMQRDRQGRITADIFLMDGRNLAYELIKEGLAWSRGELAETQRYVDEEELARAAGKGLWSEADPLPPWKWKEPNKARRKFSN